VKVKIRKGDTVEVISGRRDDKGQRGEVIKVLPDVHRVVVQGINIRKKHQRQVQQAQGRNLRPGIIEFDAPMDISNVMVVCPKCDAPVRIAVQRDEAGKAQRLCKKCGNPLD
jgi:large subunit ribosomal protein L24